MSITTLPNSLHMLDQEILGNSCKNKKNELINDLNALDIQSLLQRQKKLIEAIKKHKDDMPHSDFLAILSRLFEHSVEDGYQLAQETRITPQEYLPLMLNERFAIKHMDFLTSLRQTIKDKRNKISENNKALAKHMIEDIEEYKKTYNEKNKEPIQMPKRFTNEMSPVAGELLQEMDDIYSQYLRIQNFKEISPTDKRTTGERLADHLFWNIMNSGKYYTSGIISAIYDNIVKDFDPAEENYYLEQKHKVIKFLKYIGYRDEKNSFEEEMIDEATIKDILDVIAANKHELAYDEKQTLQSIESRIKNHKYKPLGLIFNQRRYLAEKQNKEELEQMFYIRFGAERKEKVQLTYDAKQGIYTTTVEKNEQEHPNEYTHTIPIDSYDEVRTPQNIDGKIAFTAKKDGKWFVIDHTGNKIGGEFDEVGTPQNIDGKIAFTAEKDGKEFVIDHTGNKIGGEFDEVRDPHNIDGKIAFKAKKNGKWFVIDHTGNKIGGEFDEVGYPENIDGKIAFTAEKNGKEFVIDHTGSKISEEFDEVRTPQNIDGKIAFIAKKNGKWFVIDHTGNKIGGEFDKVRPDLRNIDGKIAFKAKKDGKWFVIDHTGNKIGGEFDWVGDPQNIDGKIAFKAEKDGKWFVIDHTGSKISEEFDEVRTPQNIDGKIAFTAKKNGKEFVIDHTGSKISEEFDEVRTPQNIDGKIAFTAKKNGKWFVIDHTGNKIGGEFDEVGDPHNIDGKIAFRAKKDGKWFVIDHTGNKIGGEFDKVGYPQNIDGKIAFTAEKNGKEFIIDHTGNKIGGEFDKVRTLHNIDGKIAFKAKKDGKWFVIDYTGNKIGGEFDEVRGFWKTGEQRWFVGKRNGVVKQRNIEDNEHEELMLTDKEMQKLELLNLCVPFQQRPGTWDTYKEEIQQHQAKAQIAPDKNYAKKHRVKFINDTVKAIPGLFIDTLAAKKDKNTAILSDNICQKIFPEAYIEERRNPRYGNLGNGGGGNGGENNNRETNNGGSEKRDPSDYLQPQESDGMEGADPVGEVAAEGSDTILKIRGNINDIIVIDIYGKYDTTKKRRYKHYFHIPRSIISGPSDITTITLPHIAYHKPLSLPKPINANIILERVQGITADGKQIPLTVSTNALNESTVTIEDKSIKEIVYSIETAQLPPKIQDIDQKQYEQFKNKFLQETKTDEQSTVMLEEIANLDEDELLFLDSIKNDSPKHKLIKIEQYIRDNSYYDMEEKEMMNIKRGKSMEERIYISKQRMSELKTRYPQKKQLQDKKRAGVCADFSIISVAMLRKAGFLSGTIVGFLTDSDTVNETNIHGIAYAIMPDERGRNQIITIDGMPHGSGHSSSPSLAEQEDIRQQKEQEIEAEIQKELEEIDQTLEEGDKTKIKEIIGQTFNGSLEGMLNIVLKKEIRTTHYAHISNLLHVYRYTPLKDMDIESSEAQTFIQKEINRTDQKTSNFDYQQEAKAGTLLFEMIQDFVRRFTQQEHDSIKALQRIEKLIQSCENILNPTEYKAMQIIIKYLKAENIKGKK